jgi:hypothetical protein
MKIIIKIEKKKIEQTHHSLFSQHKQTERERERERGRSEAKCVTSI